MRELVVWTWIACALGSAFAGGNYTWTKSHDQGATAFVAIVSGVIWPGMVVAEFLEPSTRPLDQITEHP